MPELRVDDPVPSADHWVRELMPTTLVAEDEGVVGYLYHQIFGEVGYVRNVVSSPSHRRKGIGRALMEAARAVFQNAGATSWCLNVKPDNTEARALYDALGLKVAYRSEALRIEWANIRAWPRAKTDAQIRIEPIEPVDDLSFESTHRLLPGQLAAARMQQDRVILGLSVDDQPTGVLVFNPHYPGCFPFRVAGPEWLPVFLQALEAYKRPEHDYVQLVIEDQDESARALRAHGAELRLEILNLRAPL